jgi:flagellar hook-length control protein FliK
MTPPMALAPPSTSSSVPSPTVPSAGGAGPPGAPPDASRGAPPGAPPGASPFHSALATHWARTATAEGHHKDDSRTHARGRHESAFAAHTPPSALIQGATVSRATGVPVDLPQSVGVAQPVDVPQARSGVAMLDQAAASDAVNTLAGGPASQAVPVVEPVSTTEAAHTAELEAAPAASPEPASGVAPASGVGSTSGVGPVSGVGSTFSTGPAPGSAAVPASEPAPAGASGDDPARPPATSLPVPQPASSEPGFSLSASSQPASSEPALAPAPSPASSFVSTLATAGAPSAPLQEGTRSSAPAPRASSGTPPVTTASQATLTHTINTPALTSTAEGSSAIPTATAVAAPNQAVNQGASTAPRAQAPSNAAVATTGNGALAESAAALTGGAPAAGEAHATSSDDTHVEPLASSMSGAAPPASTRSPAARVSSVLPGASGTQANSATADTAPGADGEIATQSAFGNTISAQATATGVDAGFVTAAGVPMQEMIDSIRSTVEMATRQGIARARIELQPQELGHVSIRLSQTAEGLRARVTADTPAGAQALAQGHSELRQSLSSLGVSLLRLDIGSFGQHQARGQGERFTGRSEGSSGPRTDVASEEGTPIGETAAASQPAGPAMGEIVDVLA